MSETWKNKKERGSPILIRLITWLALHLGRTPSRILLYPICVYFLLFSPKANRASKNYLTLALGRVPRITDLFRHYFCFASTVLDRVFFLSGREALFDIQITNKQWFHDFILRHKNSVFMGAHMGSFDMLRVLGTGNLQLSIKVLMYRDNANKTNAVFSSLNPDFANCIIPVGGIESMLQIKVCADKGDSIGVMADRVYSDEKTVTCNFFGRPARFPAGPLLMAATLKLPVLMCFGLYAGANRYDVFLELLAEEVTISRENREADVQQWAQRFADRLEYYCRKSPYNWFNFYDFWHQEP